MRNIRIEGSIPGLVNLKPRTAGQKEIVAEKVAYNNVGYVGDLLLENIQIESQFQKGDIFGAANASLDKKRPFLVKNVEFNNITVGGETVDIDNWKAYFDIDTTTVENIRFNGDSVLTNVDYGAVATTTLKVQAEDYEEMLGIQTEATTDADGGENIGFIQDGDWASYIVDIPEDGTYEFSARAASGSAGGEIVVYIDDDETGTVVVDNEATNGWQDWYTTIPIELELESGEIDLKLEFTGGSGFLFNLNWVQFVQYSETNLPTITANTRLMVYPNPSSSSLTVGNIKAVERIAIYQLNGKMILEQIGNNKHVDVSSLSPGMYLIQVDALNERFTHKFIKR